MPGPLGSLSDAIKLRLIEEDLQDLETLLRYRGIRTKYALEHLTSNETAVILHKARQLYEIFDISKSSLTKSLYKVMGIYDPAMDRALGCAYPGLGCSETAMPSLPEPQPDDTYLRRMLGPTLMRAWNIVGPERSINCLRRLAKSQELAEASAMEAAEAFAAFIKDMPIKVPKKRRPQPKNAHEVRRM
jgi:hypothetical protein